MVMQAQIGAGKSAGRPHGYLVSCALVMVLGLIPFALTTMLPGDTILAHAEAPMSAYIKRAHYVMGTIFEIEAYHHDPAAAEAAIEAAFQEILRADQMMSHYREDSSLSLLNQQGALGPVRLPEELYQLLRASVQFSQQTRGAFDVTTNSLTEAWRLAEQRGIPLNDAELTIARQLVGAGRLIFDAAHSTVRFDRAGVRVDLGGIAKGWAVDRAANLLRARGVRSALINAGTSTIYAIGAPPGESAWRIGIRAPKPTPAADSEEDGMLLGTVALRDMSLSTSSSSERYFEIGGARYSHILDPRTGMPAASLATASVVSPSATESDALSTASFVLGLEQASQLLLERRLSGLLVPRGAGGLAAAAKVIAPAGQSGPLIAAEKVLAHE